MSENFTEWGATVLVVYKISNYHNCNIFHMKTESEHKFRLLSYKKETSKLKKNNKLIFSELF